MNRTWCWAWVLWWAAVELSLPARAQQAAALALYQFAEPHRRSYRVEVPPSGPTLLQEKPQWVRAIPVSGGAPIEFGRRVVLQLRQPAALPRLLAGTTLKVHRWLDADLVLLEAPDPWAACTAAQRLAALPEALASYPVRRRRVGLHGPFAERPNDRFYSRQWHLENRHPDGSVAGPDLNLRAAWPFTQGEGVVVAMADDGVESTHPDLAERLVGAPHYDFVNNRPSPDPVSTAQGHGTSVAGIIAATSDNRRGVAGVAPRAQLASWVIFGAFDTIVSEEQLMDMFQFASNIVAVQNHSWGNADAPQLGATLLERRALTNAITKGRGGKGIILVRSGGNNREDGGDTNDDEYAADPRAIAVAAVRTDGRAATYSNPGACLLVAAPSSDLSAGFPGIVTTDRQGPLGENRLRTGDDANDYALDASAFTGTSASAPQISGLAALLLSVNPSLTYRDVQQILIQAARHFDEADPDLRANGAGFRVSHNVGFGVPDAGVAVRLAAAWPNRPPLTNVLLTATNPLAIPDDALRLEITGPDLPPNLQSIRTLPSEGPHADEPTPWLPLTHLGLVTTPITNELAGAAALIQRGDVFFREKINFAADAGAGFVVIYNNRDADQLVHMGLTDYTTVPAVFIGQNDGEALRGYLAQHPEARARLRLESATYTFDVSATLLCEHVGVRVRVDHPRRGDLRITLRSPQGTRSVLQHLNFDDSPGPEDWTYYSTHHFYESSAGTWTVAVSDEGQHNAGSVLEVDLILFGVTIRDTDRDGLDDAWELAHFGSLARGPSEDPDRDGYSNAREQVLGTDPAASHGPFVADLSRFDPTLLRLSWPSSPEFSYRILDGEAAAAPLDGVATVPGRFPETEWFLPVTGGPARFFRIEAVPRPQ
jgi:subtilisin family serine protease